MLCVEVDVGEELRAVTSGAEGGRAVPHWTLLGPSFDLLRSLLYLLPSPGLPRARTSMCNLCIFVKFALVHLL